MASFEFDNAIEVGRVFNGYGVRYLFFGKSGAIILGFSDTTQDVDLFVDKNPENCNSIVSAMLDLGFQLNDKEQHDILRGKDFVQLRNGPFDLDLIFAPDGIERFEDAWSRRVDSHGLPVARIDDIIASKQAANRQRDRESLPRLISFKNWLERSR